MEPFAEIDLRGQENTRVIKESFIKRYFPVIVVIVFSMCSLSTMSYFIIKMRGWPQFPSFTKKQEVPTEQNLSFQELVEQDKKIISKTVMDLFGEKAVYISQYAPTDVETMKYRHKELGASRGSLFVQIKGVYYYLSPDGKRLYWVGIKNDNKAMLSLSKEVRQSNPAQKNCTEKIYKDKDGFYRNTIECK